MAATAARRFIDANPRSPHAPHLRRVIEGSPIP
jgi:hypothetical protein